MNTENVLYPNKKIAFVLTGTEDELDEAVYLFEALFHYIEGRAEYGWTESERDAAMKMLAEDAQRLKGEAALIIKMQSNLFTIDVINKYYKKVLRGKGNIHYSVDDYIYNDEFYDVADDPITFWTNTIAEREYVKLRLQQYQNRMMGDLKGLNSLALMDREFIKNPLLTGDEIIRFLDMTEEILDFHKEY